VISSAAVKPENVVNGNNFLLESAKAESRFIPLCSFHPDMDYGEAVKELERVKKAGAKGIKLHPDFQHFPIDREDIFPYYAVCAELKAADSVPCRGREQRYFLADAAVSRYKPTAGFGRDCGAYVRVSGVGRGGSGAYRNAGLHRNLGRAHRASAGACVQND
jgi:predicted TIM-barrel fold metal-dependent hydrolase